MLRPAGKPNALNFKKIVGQKIHCTDKVFLVGIRGYFLDTMGATSVNDRKIYDDAIAIFANNSCMPFNANVDAGAFRTGIANLEKGTWIYKVGIHGLNKPKALQYQAYVQAASVTVMRDNQGLDTGMFGINIHRGGENTVSSLGCQTIVPDQWSLFNNTLKSALELSNQKTFKYFLI